MPSTKSPRRLVLRNVKDQASPNIQTVSGATPSVQTGVIRLHSSDVPGLELGETYTAKFQQSITLPGEKPILNSQTQFKVSGSPYTLEPSLIDSVYPPPGHSDYWSKSFEAYLGSIQVGSVADSFPQMYCLMSYSITSKFPGS